MADIVERLVKSAEFFEQPPPPLIAPPAWPLDRILRDAAAEIERLRAALESLTKDPPATLDEPDDDAEVIIKMRAIARDALNIHDCAENEHKV